MQYRLLTLLPFFALSALAQPGSQLDIGARPAVLGASYVAIADDGYAAYWNPAGLPLLRSQEINAMRSDLHRTGYIHSYLGYAVPFTDRFTASTDWSHQGFDDDELHFGQNLWRRDDPLSLVRLRYLISVLLAARAGERPGRKERCSI